MSMTSAAEVSTQAVSPELMALGAAFTQMSPSFHAATKRPMPVRRDEAYVAGAAESVPAELPSGNAPVARRFPLRTTAEWKGRLERVLSLALARPRDSGALSLRPVPRQLDAAPFHR